MSEKKIIKPVALAVGAAIAGTFAISGAVNADTDESPFAMSTMDAGYMVASADGHGDKKGEGCCVDGCCGETDKKGEGSCGEGSCGESDKKGEGSCGEGSCGESHGDKKGEGSCGEKEGEGSCGSST